MALGYPLIFSLLQSEKNTLSYVLPIKLEPRTSASLNNLTVYQLKTYTYVLHTNVLSKLLESFICKKSNLIISLYAKVIFLNFSKLFIFSANSTIIRLVVWTLELNWIFNFFFLRKQIRKGQTCWKPNCMEPSCLLVKKSLSKSLKSFL